MIRDVFHDYELFCEAFEVTVGVEGGYSNDPNDPGGETMWGISKRSHPTLDIGHLTIGRAQRIYYSDYWLPLRLDRIEDETLCMKLFDVGVNCGLVKAVEILQLAANYLIPFGVELDVDGKLGPRTVAAVNSLKPDRLVAALCGEQYLHYRGLVESGTTHRFESFAGGWVLRAMLVPRRKVVR